MALTYSTETGTGASKVYNIAWESKLGYLDASHVHVYTGDDYTENVIDFTWINDTQLECSVPLGTVFYIRRVTPRNEAINDYTDGAILREQNLDDSFAQTLMVQEEITDGYLTTNSDVLFKNNLDMQGKRLVNVGDPIEDQDAINKGTFDNHKAEQGLVDAAQDAWNTQQDNRVLSLEEAVVVADAQYVANFNHTATGGETTLETNYTFSYAVVAINGILQTIGKAFNILGSSIVLAGELEIGDEVTAILTVPFVTSTTFVGTGDWIFTAVGGELTVDTGLEFTGILLTINGIVQTPTRAFSVLGTVLTFASALQKGDELYAMLSTE